MTQRRWHLRVGPRLTLGAGALALALGLALLSRRPAPVSGDAAAQEAQQEAARRADAGARRGAPDASAALAPASFEGERPQWAARLRERYGARLEDVGVQVRMLEELVRHFRARLPEGAWQAAVRALLEEAFPGRAGALMELLGRWLQYEAWVRTNQEDLRQLEPEARRAALWETRRQLFGEAQAEQVWAAARRAEAGAALLRTVDALPAGAGVGERLARYREGLAEVHGERAEAFLARHRQEALDAFLALGSVQQELGGLPREARAAELRRVREGLGLDAEALGRWDALDAARDARWEAGRRYLAEREELLKRESGARLEADLAALRLRYFGEEAELIADEERAGLLRFTQPRVWGRN